MSIKLGGAPVLAGLNEVREAQPDKVTDPSQWRKRSEPEVPKSRPKQW